MAGYLPSPWRRYITWPSWSYLIELQYCLVRAIVEVPPHFHATRGREQGLEVSITLEGVTNLLRKTPAALVGPSQNICPDPITDTTFGLIACFQWANKFLHTVQNGQWCISSKPINTYDLKAPPGDTEKLDCTQTHIYTESNMQYS